MSRYKTLAFRFTKKVYVLLCLTLLLLTALLVSACGKKEQAACLYTFQDAQGTTISMPAKPRRILTTSIGTDEMLLGLVEPERIVAVQALLEDAKSSNVTQLINHIPHRITAPSLELLVALKPDLVIVPDWGNLENVGAMRDAGLTVMVCKGPRTVAQIKETIRLLALATGETERGEQLVSMMEQKLTDIKQRTAAIPPEQRKSVVLLSLMGGYGGIGSTFDEACQLSHVRNARADLGIKDGQPMTKEQLIQANPDILFLPTYDNNGTYDLAGFRSRFLDDPSLHVISAIKNKQLAEPFEGYIYSCSQDFVFGVQEIAYRVYGDAFKQPPGQHLSAVK